MSARIRSDVELDLIATAKRVLPGGSFGNFAADVVIREGRGGRVWDESGNEYVDVLLGSGPMLVGHGHPEEAAGPGTGKDLARDDAGSLPLAEAALLADHLALEEGAKARAEVFVEVLIQTAFHAPDPTAGRSARRRRRT